MKLAFLTAAAVACAFSVPALAQFSTVAPLQNWTPTPQMGGYFVNNYQLDDGTTENALGLTAGGDFVHIQRYSAVGGADVITKVMSAFGATINGAAQTPAPGTGITVYVWEDPNDDGNPVDGVLLGSAAGVITNVNNNVLDPFPVAPVAVSNVFHVGCRVPQTAGQFPGPMDTTLPAPAGNVWVTGNGTQNSYTGTPVTGTIGLFDVTAIGFPCNWLLRAEGGAPTTVYCTAKITFNGCTPAIGSTGVPSAAPAGFVVNGTNMINNKSCLLFYGVNTGQAATPFQGGLLCVKTPIKRTPATNSGGNPPPNDCSGAPAIDMNCFAAGLCGGAPAALMHTTGNIINCQWWGRDPGFPSPNNTQLSDGLEYVVQ